MTFHDFAFALAFVLSYVEGAPSSPILQEPGPPNLHTTSRRQTAPVISGVEANSILGFPYLWTTSLEVGGQVRNLLIDITSTDLWIEPLGPGMTGRKPASYNSLTFQRLTYIGFTTTDIISGSSLSGAYGADSVNVAGVGSSNQTIEIVNYSPNSSPAQYDYDGVLGLGLKNLSNGGPQTPPSFLESVQTSGSVPTFAMNSQQGQTTFTFGSMDDSSYSGQLVTLSVDNAQSGIPNTVKSGGTLLPGGWIVQALALSSVASSPA